MLKPLPPKGTIAVLAPAFPPNPEKLEKGIQYLKGMGFTVVRGESLSARHWYFAGNDTLRAHELNRMFADPDIDAIICARGGWGTLRLLDQLDYALIKANPKMLVGYSDITTLHLAIWSRAGLPGISGPMVAVEMGTGIVPFTESHFWQQVRNTQTNYRFDFNAESIEIWSGGQASGTLLGGCLSMIAHQLGTSYSPDYSGAILFVEDVGEEPYKIDRYLAQLKQAGVLEQINGLIIGEFIDCEETSEDRSQVDVKEILRDYFGDRPYPVVYNFPYGHGMRKFTMPIGVPAILDNEAKTLTVGNPFGG